MTATGRFLPVTKRQVSAKSGRLRAAPSGQKQTFKSSAKLWRFSRALSYALAEIESWP